MWRRPSFHYTKRTDPWGGSSAFHCRFHFFSLPETCERELQAHCRPWSQKLDDAIWRLSTMGDPQNHGPINSKMGCNFGWFGGSTVLRNPLYVGNDRKCPWQFTDGYGIVSSVLVGLHLAKSMSSTSQKITSSETRNWCKTAGLLNTEWFHSKTHRGIS